MTQRIQTIPTEFFENPILTRVAIIIVMVILAGIVIVAVPTPLAWVFVILCILGALMGAGLDPIEFHAVAEGLIETTQFRPFRWSPMTVKEINESNEFTESMKRDLLEKLYYLRFTFYAPRIIILLGVIWWQKGAIVTVIIPKFLETLLKILNTF